MPGHSLVPRQATKAVRRERGLPGHPLNARKSNDQEL